MFAIISKRTGQIWNNKKNGMFFIFSSEKDAWTLFLNHFSEEEQRYSEIVPIGWVKK